MITPSEEYRNQLWHFQYNNHTVNYNIQIPQDEPVYQVDLTSRKIEAPKNLGVVEDHQAERIFFEIDRDCNGIDLATTIGIIVFKNAKDEVYTYVIPEYILPEDSDKMIFSWLLQAPLTAYAGRVQFMIKFFRINQTDKTIEFEFNTQTASSVILEAWPGALTTYANDYQVLLDPEIISLFGLLQTVIDQGYFDIYWTDL